MHKIATFFRRKYVHVILTAGTLLFALLGGYYIGFKQGQMRERAGNVAVFRIALPVDVASKLSQGKECEAFDTVEPCIEMGMLWALEYRDSFWLDSETKRSLNMVLEIAFKHREKVGYDGNIENYRSGLKEEFYAAKKEFLGEENHSNSSR